MKCEICHQSDATAVIHLKKGDDTQELYVCKSCAAKAGQPSKRKKRAESPPEIALDDNGEPPEFVKNLLEATIGFMKGVAETNGKKKVSACPACKTPWKQIKETGLVGCPQCWNTFASQLRETFLSREYGPKHVGDMPRSITGEASRAFLERELKAAVAREDFKKAAAIKRQLDALADGKGDE